MTIGGPREAIAFDGVRLAYGSGSGPVLALDSIDLTVGSGEFAAVVGPSGCGKSTLVKLAAGLLLPSAGTVRIERAVSHGPNPQVGIAFQNPLLKPERTVLDNILLPIEIGGGHPEAYMAAARKLMKVFGLGGVDDRRPGELSEGMQQRVSLCRALIHNPRILLLDEPFGMLDAMTRAQLNADLQRIWLALGKTVLMITHNIEEAVYLADRVVVLSPRPSRVVAEVAVDLPRPRTIAMMETPGFARLTDMIRHHLRAAGADL